MGDEAISDMYPTAHTHPLHQQRVVAYMGKFCNSDMTGDPRPRADNSAALAAVFVSLLGWLVALWRTGALPGPSNLWPSVVGIGAGTIACVLVAMRPRVTG